MKLEATLRALYDEAVEFVIIGGAALRLQGSARLTEDLDFCYSRSPRNVQNLAKAIQPFHAHLRNAPEGLPFKFDAQAITNGMNFTLPTDLGALDFLGEVSGLGSYPQVKSASEAMTIFGLEHHVLTLEGLLKAKLAAGRAKDLDVIKEIESLIEIRNRTGISLFWFDLR